MVICVVECHNERVFLFLLGILNKQFPIHPINLGKITSVMCVLVLIVSYSLVDFEFIIGRVKEKPRINNSKTLHWTQLFHAKSLK